VSTGNLKINPVDVNKNMRKISKHQATTKPSQKHNSSNTMATMINRMVMALVMHNHRSQHLQQPVVTIGTTATTTSTSHSIFLRV
jgi:hypothetical protein